MTVPRVSSTRTSPLGLVFPRDYKGGSCGFIDRRRRVLAACPPQDGRSWAALAGPRVCSIHNVWAALRPGPGAAQPAADEPETSHYHPG